MTKAIIFALLAAWTIHAALQTSVPSSQPSLEEQASQLRDELEQLRQENAQLQSALKELARHSATQPEGRRIWEVAVVANPDEFLGQRVRGWLESIELQRMPDQPESYMIRLNAFETTPDGRRYAKQVRGKTVAIRCIVVGGPRFARMMSRGSAVSIVGTVERIEKHPQDPDSDDYTLVLYLNDVEEK